MRLRREYSGVIAGRLVEQDGRTGIRANLQLLIDQA